jgi:predicted secreted protein
VEQARRPGLPEHMAGMEAASAEVLQDAIAYAKKRLAELDGVAPPAGRTPEQTKALLLDIARQHMERDSGAPKLPFPEGDAAKGLTFTAEEMQKRQATYEAHVASYLEHSTPEILGEFEAVLEESRQALEEVARRRQQIWQEEQAKMDELLSSGPHEQMRAQIEETLQRQTKKEMGAAKELQEQEAKLALAESSAALKEDFAAEHAAALAEIAALEAEQKVLVESLHKGTRAPTVRRTIATVTVATFELHRAMADGTSLDAPLQLLRQVSESATAASKAGNSEFELVSAVVPAISAATADGKRVLASRIHLVSAFDDLKDDAYHATLLPAGGGASMFER